MSGTAAALPSGLRHCLGGYRGGNWESGAFGARLAVRASAVNPMTPQMPDSKLVMFGKPAVGAAVMLAAPLAALDIPLKVLVWEDRNGAVSVSYNSPGFVAERHHLEGALRAPLDAVEPIAEALPGA
jgi:hypothetical protein